MYIPYYKQTNKRHVDKCNSFESYMGKQVLVW